MLAACARKAVGRPRCGDTLGEEPAAFAFLSISSGSTTTGMLKQTQKRISISSPKCIYGSTKNVNDTSRVLEEREASIWQREKHTHVCEKVHRCLTHTRTKNAPSTSSDIHALEQRSVEQRRESKRHRCQQMLVEQVHGHWQNSSPSPVTSTSQTTTTTTSNKS